MPSPVHQSYDSQSAPLPTNMEKAHLSNEDHSCGIHGTSQTPHIDQHLHEPKARDYLLTLSEALADAADDNSCTQCVVELIGRTMTAVAKDVRTAKKSGQWSKEERKALKKESKLITKEMKKDLKALWKEEK